MLFYNSQHIRANSPQLIVLLERYKYVYTIIFETQINLFLLQR